MHLDTINAYSLTQAIADLTLTTIWKKIVQECLPQYRRWYSIDIYIPSVCGSQFSYLQPIKHHLSPCNTTVWFITHTRPHSLPHLEPHKYSASCVTHVTSAIFNSTIWTAGAKSNHIPIYDLKAKSNTYHADYWFLLY